MPFAVPDGCHMPDDKHQNMPRLTSEGLNDNPAAGMSVGNLGIEVIKLEHEEEGTVLGLPATVQIIGFLIPRNIVFLAVGCAGCGLLLILTMMIIIYSGGGGGGGIDHTTLVVVSCPSYPCKVTAGLAKLPVSSSNSVLLLLGTQSHGSRRTSSIASFFPIARSYGGNIWETIQESRHEVRGDNVIMVIAGGSFEIVSYKMGEPATNEEKAARFLMESTFGPKKAEISSLATALGRSSSALQSWINAQIALPATLHRAYFRHRANPRLVESVFPTGGLGLLLIPSTALRQLCLCSPTGNSSCSLALL